MRKIQSFVLAATLLVSTNVFAKADCPKNPKEKWLSEEQMKAKITEMGYKIKVFKVSGDCYEIYGWNKEGKKVEIYFNTADGSIVKSEIR